jgi:hypothetical protein
MFLGILWCGCITLLVVFSRPWFRLFPHPGAVPLVGREARTRDRLGIKLGNIVLTLRYARQAIMNSQEFALVKNDFLKRIESLEHRLPELKRQCLMATTCDDFKVLRKHIKQAAKEADGIAAPFGT